MIEKNLKFSFKISITQIIFYYLIYLIKIYSINIDMIFK
jgi:hypothetical protein